MIKTFTIDDEKWRVVPVEPTDEMLDAAGSIAFAEEIKADYSAMIAAAPQPEPVESEPVAKVLFIDGLESNNLLDCDLPVGTLLYTTPQPDRTAELEAALMVARDALDTCQWYSPGGCWLLDPDKVEEALAKINEVLHD